MTDVSLVFVAVVAEKMDSMLVRAQAQATGVSESAHAGATKSFATHAGVVCRMHTVDRT